MTFILVALLILHSLRKIIGSAAFYIALGLLLVFNEIVSSTGIKVSLDIYPGADFYIASTVIFLPYLTALMIIYITEGTLATQRMIIGAMATLGIFIYLSHITETQCSWPGFSISQGPSADSMQYLLRQSQKTMAGSILAQTLDLFMIPIFFQRLRNLNCRLFISVLGSLMLTQIVDSFVYVTACYWGSPEWWMYISSSYIAKAIATIWLSAIATIYLSRNEKEIPGEGRGTLDIFFAFFGSYGIAQQLKKNLIEWEGRYKMVVENASEMILLLDRNGKILDANLAAARILRTRSRKELIGRNVSEMIYDSSGERINWENYRDSFKIEDTTDGPHIQRLSCHIVTSSKEKVELDMALSGIEMGETPVMMVLGRDVTEENQLAREKEELSLRLTHAQRIESIGQLAGGVAHDFNNYLHAIQGNVDVLTLTYDVQDENVLRHLEKISDITEKAAALTQQLLGFARKGKYIVKSLDLNALVLQSIDLFMPKSQEDIELDVKLAPGKMLIKGDNVQLQQVILNLLINARDALENSSAHGIIKVRTSLASKLKIKMAPPPELPDIRNEAGKYYAVTISDNGCGILPEDLLKIFEPFFTTKPFGKGTGMGLAMVYGTITAHKGWIQVESKENKGSSFYVFLPACGIEP